MNYQQIYKEIVKKAQFENRKKKCGVYYEKHHIIPRCMKGLDEKNNIVLLTAKEHYICHKLLMKIYPFNKSLRYAFYRMTFDKKHKTSARDYAYAKILFNSIPKNKSEKAKKNMSKAKKGRNYKSLFGKKYKQILKLRQNESSGANNGMAKKYIFINLLTNETWLCHGKLTLFCKTNKISSFMLKIMKETNAPVNNWKREIFNEIMHNNYKVF